MRVTQVRKPLDPHGLKDAIARSPYTQEQVIGRTVGSPRKPQGLVKSTLTKIIRGEGEAWPTDQTILILGEAMDASPGHWPQYDLARARELLNPRFVDLPTALDNYNAACAALGLPRITTDAAKRVPANLKVAAQQAERRQASQATRPAQGGRGGAKR